MNQSLYDELRAYLADAKGKWPTIAKECGIDKSWIPKVLEGRIQDPGVRRTERILSYARSTGWAYRPDVLSHVA